MAAAHLGVALSHIWCNALKCQTIKRGRETYKQSGIVRHLNSFYWSLSKMQDGVGVLQGCVLIGVHCKTVGLYRDNRPATGCTCFSFSLVESPRITR
jgi:hypothetical protein